jgi:predicted small lipoprotein YifL
MSMSKTATAASLLLLALLVSGCGRKGPLFMPVKPAPAGSVLPVPKPADPDPSIQSSPLPTQSESQK